jgi:dynein heavy chain
MDQGLTLAVKYKQEHKELCTHRDELHFAEKLFNIPLTSYSKLSSIATFLQSPRQIYQLFGEQQETMNEWSQILWSDVNINMLIQEIDGFDYSLRKLPHELRGLSTYGFIKYDLG